jgi:YVTN family beta-propeller protein
VIDTRTNEITADIAFGLSYPTAVAISPNGDIAYVTDRGAGTVVVIDIASGAVINTIPVGNTPVQTAFSPDGTVAYVANSGDGSISIIDTASHTAITAMVVGQAPRGVAFSPDGTFAYVTDSGGWNYDNRVDGTLRVISVAGVSVDNWQPPELSGALLGAVARDGGGWLVIGNHFIFIPPRSDFMATVAQAAIPYLDQATEDTELGQHVHSRLQGRNAVSRSVDG